MKRKIIVFFFIVLSLLCISYSGKLEIRSTSETAAQLTKDPGLKLMGNRFFTFSTVIRVNQIETSRDEYHGTDESGIHSPEEARIFRETIGRAWPGASIRPTGPADSHPAPRGSRRCAGWLRSAQRLRPSEPRDDLAMRDDLHRPAQTPPSHQLGHFEAGLQAAEQRLELGRRQALGDGPALGVVATEAVKVVQRREVVDALGGDAVAQVVPELDDRADDGAVNGSIRQTHDEGLVDLEFAHRQLPQVGE